MQSILLAILARAGFNRKRLSIPSGPQLPGHMRMTGISLDHVRKVFPGNNVALRDLSLEISSGEFVVLVGPSGCGKSTTLRLIAGLDAPSSGSIRIGAREVNGLPPHERDVAMVFQRHTVYPHLSVRRNLLFGMEMKHGSGWRRFRAPAELAARVAEIARMLGIETLLERRADQLSGGQQQRVALARAILRQPGVLLLDEPLSQLDAALRSEMRRELHLLHKRFPATILHVTHDPVEAMTLADRVVVLDCGVVQQADRPLDVYDQPRNRFVAGFFGWPPMNLLNGDVVHQEGRPCFADACRQWAIPLPEEPAASGRVTFGIRPEDLTVRPRTGSMEGTESGVVLPARVALLEPLGASSLVTVERGEARMTAVGSGRPELREGQEVDVVLDMNRTHLFNGTDGAAGRLGPRTG